MSPACVVEILSGGLLPKGGTTWHLGNEIRPADLYCYLYARFGPPNGIQNLLRGDHSDNLIHWDWTLGHKNGLIIIQGLNLRSEVHLLGDWSASGFERHVFIEEVKRDLLRFGKEMSKLRKETLEDWDMFVNPYQNLRASVLRLKKDLDALQLDPTKEQLTDPTSTDDIENFREQFLVLISRYNQGIGLAMALRLMIPVLAESFVNFLLFVLCRPDIKSNNRLYDATVRANIDVKVQSLHINCLGFKSPVDWASEECAKYSSVVNERNDLLHGNLVIDKMKYGEIFFNGTVPVFKMYKTLWQQSVGISVETAEVGKVEGNLAAVDGFIEHVLSRLDETVREDVEALMEKRDLGRDKKTHRLGVLLPDHLVDFHMGPKTADEEAGTNSPVTDGQPGTGAKR